MGECLQQECQSKGTEANAVLQQCPREGHAPFSPSHRAGARLDEAATAEETRQGRGKPAENGAPEEEELQLRPFLRRWTM